MANWKKVIVSGSDADLAKVTASIGLNIPDLNVGDNNNFVLTVNPSGSVEKRDPNTIGAAFQSMSIAGGGGGDITGSATFIADSGLNELIFVSSSTITLATSQSITPDGPSETIGYLKINALTSSVVATENQTIISGPVGSVYTVGTVQDINTGSYVAFGTVSASGDITAANLNIAGDIRHLGDTDTKIQFETDTINFDTGGSERMSITSAGKVGIGTSDPKETLGVHGNISASGHISGSGNLYIGGDFDLIGDLGIGGSIFGLSGFGVTIDDVAITSGSVNFGSGSLPSNNQHKFTGSISVTGSGITLKDGVFAGDGNSLTNLDADNLVDIHDLTFGTTLTGSNSSVYNVTTSLHLDVQISGSANTALTSSTDGLYIQGAGIVLGHLTASKNEGDLITFSGSAKTPVYITMGAEGTVLTAGAGTASFKALPASTGMGIETGSVDDNFGSAVSIIVTSSISTVSKVSISGSDNQITVSGSDADNTIHLRLAKNLTGITSITASGGISVNHISASGNVSIGGNLTVLGDTTLIETTNLLVEDSFITLASASNGAGANDGGIIIQDSAEGGKAFGWDSGIGRWGLQNNLASDTDTITPTQWMVSAFITGSNPYNAGVGHETPTYGQTDSDTKRSSGQLWINTGSGDIWIYVD
jgi:hypothetical protein